MDSSFAPPTDAQRVNEDVPHFDDIASPDDADMRCLADIQALLKRHGKQDRFTVGLAHRHFDLADDERLVETTDEVARISIVRPMMAAETQDARPSVWHFTKDGPKPLLWCYGALRAHP